MTKNLSRLSTAVQAKQAFLPPSIGLDIGSTTIKAIALDQDLDIVFKKYERHFSNVRASLLDLLRELRELYPLARLCVTGSGALSLAKEADFPFLQEVYASSVAIARQYPDAQTLIELGGEDAKVIFLGQEPEQRMNETCAGGTGAFLDQMAAFLETTTEGLDRLALNAKNIYQIASRCGVFAKSDIIPLLNSGCSREDVAGSIMQSVVNQTISGLAQGRSIKGKVIFLGGPLHFLTSLKKAFIASLPDLTEAVFPEEGHFFVALGAAINGCNCQVISLEEAIGRIQKNAVTHTQRLPRLFSSVEAYQKFKQSHSGITIRRRDLGTVKGPVWLGLDCGSTTLKAVLINEEGEIIYSRYLPSHGAPLADALDILRKIYDQKCDGLRIAGSCVIGYGGEYLRNALRIDLEEVETLAHFRAAKALVPDVSFILDIGGQDIKGMRIVNGILESISLNEACSAGCGSFMENFAQSLGLPLEEFVRRACFATNPVDLGTRCTVFMNSRVRHAQKDGMAMDDIAAGLTYAVIRNALYKVLKIRDRKTLGDRIVVQGGAFLNDGLLKALETELGITVIRPADSGLMGAYGAALLARDKITSGELVTSDEVKAFRIDSRSCRCKGCPNACLLTISTFCGERSYISGNRCERPRRRAKNTVPNLYGWKYNNIFFQSVARAARGVVGIPRVLNMYENYPLWHTLLTTLGYQVVLSDPSSQELFLDGLASIPSQTVCFPAKLAHGHIMNLIAKGVKTIFLPSVREEQKCAAFGGGLHNCPVVTGYPELLRLNIQALQSINYICDFLPLEESALTTRLLDIPFFSDISRGEMEIAVKAAFLAMAQWRDQVRSRGENLLKSLAGRPAIILGGHPYHIDPGIHHGIADLVAELGVPVFSEDSLAHLVPDPLHLRVVDQWAYHSRLYRAAALMRKYPNLGFIQLVSFGCGLDAVTADQIEEILKTAKGRYAQIKIDEGVNLGQAKIRIRSLLATLNQAGAQRSTPVPPAPDRDYKTTHRYLIPQMSPWHFQFAKNIFGADGYEVELLPRLGSDDLDLGLAHVNNDACYPAIMVCGQLLSAVKHGGYDPDRIALLVSQTGGACRATNYRAFLRKALDDAGFSQVPVAGFSTTLTGPGIRPSAALIRRLIMAGHYGDAFLRILHRLRPYEREKGAVEELLNSWVGKAAANIEAGDIIQFNKNILAMIGEFDKLPLNSEKRRERVGLVGEIMLKYNPQANNEIVSLLEREGAEVISTDIMDFIMYSLYREIFSWRRLNGKLKDACKAWCAIKYLEATRAVMRHAFKKTRRFEAPATFQDLAVNAQKIISLGHQAGEGWLLTAEMRRMLSHGAGAILCMQPFGCLPNHIVGKGVIRKMRSLFPYAAIAALDFDPGASGANQLNRIKLLLQNRHPASG